jgi:hypothetical protein
LHLQRVTLYALQGVVVNCGNYVLCVIIFDEDAFCVTMPVRFYLRMDEDVALVNGRSTGKNQKNARHVCVPGVLFVGTFLRTSQAAWLIRSDARARWDLEVCDQKP